MDGNFVLNQEINKVESELSSKSQISTIDLALVYNLCDKYLKSKLGVDILTIFDKADQSPEDITRYIMFELFSETRIVNFLDSFGLTSLLANTIYTMGDKKIITIDERVIQNSNKRPHQMPIPTDENQIRRIFAALRKNYNLYEQLYKDKVWLINSEDRNGNKFGTARIKISPYMFFHLMGFDYANILNPNGKDRNGTPHEPLAREFSAIFPDSNQAFRILQEFGKEQRNQYTLIEMLLQNEESFLQAALDGNLANTVNIDKLELKSYSFERMGLIESASGMIFFDKQKSIQLGYGREVQHINSDIILLNDFLRKYDMSRLFGLDFVFSPFDKIKGRQISDQQSIFLTKQLGGGFNSHLFDQQMASVSSSVAGYRENDFNYSITEQGSEEGNPPGDPIDYRKFDEEDRKRVAQTLSEAIPELDQTYLNEIIKDKGHKK